MKVLTRLCDKNWVNHFFIKNADVMASSYLSIKYVNMSLRSTFSLASEFQKIVLKSYCSVIHGENLVTGFFTGNSERFVPVNSWTGS